jgi:macrolide-specific efflux system membrane fusion protein
MQIAPSDPVAHTVTSVETKSATPSIDHHQKKRPRRKRRILWLMGALLLIGAGLFGYHVVFGKAKVHYVTAVVTRGDIVNAVVEVGIVQPIKYVDVGAQTSGVLRSLKVKFGDHVEKNQLLAEIDPVLADTALISANASLNNFTAQRADKQALLVLSQAQYTRNETLFSKGYVSASARDVTLATKNAALADVHSLTAQMQQASAAVDTASANLGYTKITAPMAGEVVSISLLEGQTLNANQSAPTILRIADISTVTVWTQVSEADIVHVKPGQDVYFTILGEPRRWNGKIRQILPTPELINSVVFYDVLFDIPNPKHVLKIQMTAQVFIVLAQAKDALLLPVAAIANAGEGATVKVNVLTADGHLAPRTIKIGITNDISAQVTDGLQEKELVVMGGMKVKKSKAKSALSGQRGP